MSALLELLEIFRATAHTEREKGTYFERLVKAYLQRAVLPRPVRRQRVVVGGVAQGSGQTRYGRCGQRCRYRSRGRDHHGRTACHPDPYALSGLVLEQRCKVIDHALLDNVVDTRSLDLQSGPLHVDGMISTPTKLLLQKFPGNPGKGASLYLAVHPDGTIAPRLWTGRTGETELDRNVGKISLVPANCRYVRSSTPASTLEPATCRTGVQLVYMGRDPSGLLKFAQVEYGMSLQQALVPAQPGKYSVLGLGVRIIKVSDY